MLGLAGLSSELEIVSQVQHELHCLLLKLSFVSDSFDETERASLSDR